MNDQKSSGNGQNWLGLLLVAVAAIGGIWLFQPPLKSSRPDQEALPGAMTKTDKPYLRLWQDPFEVIAHYANNKGELEPLSSDAVFEDLRKDRAGAIGSQTPAGNGRNPFLVLGVMVTGSQYADGPEWRRRSRVAVLSGLAAARYVPVESEHLGLFTVTENPPAKTKESQRNSQTLPPAYVHVPFEWFRPSETIDSAFPPTEYKRILVLWLSEDWFQLDPLARLGIVWKTLAGPPDKPSGHFSSARLHILGPWSSTTLKTMYDKVAGEEPKRQSIPPGITFYSSSATADDDLLCPANGTPARAAIDKSLKESLKESHVGGPVGFKNLTCTDGQHASVLFEELKLRGVDPEAGHRVALLAEHDTFYGRALLKSFCQEFKLGLPENFKDGFLYFRGLDGKLAKSESGQPDGGEQSGTGVNQDKRPAIMEMDRPEGNRQLDCIRRLTTELKRRDKENTKPVKAIGILGSDVYDKLLLLQSLRTQYPDAVFFTTDLDARLFHPRELKWTRNLIVASSYGLELDEQLQRGIPPFRDTYQTALFRATLLAVDDKKARDAYKEVGTKGLVPRLFEVGNNGAHDLSMVAGGAVHPARQSEVWYREFLKCAGMAALLLSLLGLALWQVAPLPRPWVRRLFAYRRWVVLITLVVLCSAAVIAYDHSRPGGEPFSLFEGISIWPAEVLRLAAAVLGLVLLLHSRLVLHRVRDHLEREFMLDDPRVEQGPEDAETAQRQPEVTEEPSTAPAGAAGSVSGRPKRLRGILDHIWAWSNRWCECRISDWQPDSVLVGGEGDDCDRMDARQLWSRYRYLSAPANRLVRLSWGVSLYLVAACGLTWLLGLPSQPHRGQPSLVANHVALAAGVIAFVVVTAYVLDVIQLCTRLVGILAHAPTRWPDSLLAQWEAKLGLNRKYLDEWLDMLFIARLTQVVGRLIWYPCLVLFLLIVARNPYIYRFDWPVSLWLVFGLSTVFAISSAIHLRRTAGKARKQEVQRLRIKLIAAQVEEKGPAPQIERLIHEIERMDTGAFAPLTANPIIHAILLLVSAIGIPTLMQFFGGTY